MGRIVALGKDKNAARPRRKNGSITARWWRAARYWPGSTTPSSRSRSNRPRRPCASPADLLRAQAEQEQTLAKREQTAAEWKRVQRLRPDLVAAQEESLQVSLPQSTDSVGEAERPLRKTISDTDFVLAKANYSAAVANCGAAEANVSVVRASIDQAQAALTLAETNLGYTIIKSPVQGVIIDRRVNIGQTVVASLNAPSLFLIAKDLARMQVWASVNEADIGRIRNRPDMPVRFTVDAYPGEMFRGTVDQVRLNATMTQNVVTYTVVVATDNMDLRLMPYLTANLQFEVEERQNVLQVPAAALRWRPRLPTCGPTCAGSWNRP